jgi:hypothetical protein
MDARPNADITAQRNANPYLAHMDPANHFPNCYSHSRIPAGNTDTDCRAGCIVDKSNTDALVAKHTGMDPHTYHAYADTRSHITADSVRLLLCHGQRHFWQQPTADAHKQWQPGYCAAD